MKIQIPEQVNILGITYKVKITEDIKTDTKPYIYDGDEKTDYAGYFSSSALTIFLDKHTARQNMESVFIHEVIEIINHHLALNLQHDNIDRLEVALYHVLTNNNILRKD